VSALVRACRCSTDYTCPDNFRRWFPVPHHTEISATEPDWSREAKRFWSWHPSRSLLASIRCYQRLAGRRSPWSRIVSKVAVLRHLFWSTVTGADIPINTQIGGGLLMPHPNGIVINADARIGPNCLIFQQVTLGANLKGVPAIGGHVDIGAGAKIIGPVIIGDHARIGALALVVNDVGPGETVVAPAAQPIVRTRTTNHPHSG
jgi:serine O-acetyltransferase